MAAPNPFSGKGYVRVGNEIHPPIRGGKRAQVEQAINALPVGSVALVVSKSTDESKLNKTERAYLGYLRMLYPTRIGIQDVTLKIADDCRLTMDFNYINENGNWVFVDVKGFQREDALIKVKVAARLFPHLKFVIVKRAKIGWEVTEVKP